MTAPRLVAHRGLWWPRRERQNTPEALRAALERGYGVELDLCANRSVMGGWAVMHPGDGAWSALWAVLDVLGAGPGPILWNVKSPGAEAVLRDVFAGPLGARSWVFDHDHEGTDPALPERFPEGRYLWRTAIPLERGLVSGDGWWRDDYDVNGSGVVGDMDRSRHFYVSPELHGRPLDLAFARRVLDAGAWLCSDVCGLLERLDTPELNPVDPWWPA